MTAAGKLTLTTLPLSQMQHYRRTDAASRRSWSLCAGAHACSFALVSLGHAADFSFV